MSRPQDLTEPEREEGLGQRVRRFVQTELGRALEKGERWAGTHSDQREDEDHMSSAEIDQAHSPHDPSQPMHSGSVEGHPMSLGDADRPMATRDPAAATGDPAATGAAGHGQVPEQQARSEEAGARPDAAQGSSAERVGLLNDIASLREQWRGIQSTFVDDPQHAVDEAGALVDRMLDEIRTNVGSARRSESMSTEDLRVSFKRYREFFERLLSA
jgi:hypothetical protein